MDARANSAVPLSLKNAPSLIESVFPSMKISAETQKERKAGSGQTLTALGSYWKGRKPLVLVKACVLGALLPATGDPETDLDTFERLMAIDDAAFAHRAKRPADIEGLLAMPYDDRVKAALRPEELDDSVYDEIWDVVNGRLGTSADNIPSLVEQLGVMRFGRVPVVADPFSGGGSIPYEAARIGCDTIASDLNPVACMLSWAAQNVVGASPDSRKRFIADQKAAFDAAESEITRLGYELDEDGNRAKAYLYCLECTCPATGWSVPMIPSMVLSEGRSVVMKLVPDHHRRRYDLEVVEDASAEELEEADKGTIRNYRLVHPMNPDEAGVAVTAIRGDRRVAGLNERPNDLRRWEADEFGPRPDDILRERLYAIQWVAKDSLTGGRHRTWFAAPTKRDVNVESQLNAYVAANGAEWRRLGWLPSMEIETGKENEGPIRTNGWTQWHQMFTPRQLLYVSLVARHCAGSPIVPVIVAKMADYCNKSSQWRPRGEYAEQLFSGPSLRTLFSWGARSFLALKDTVLTEFSEAPVARVGRVLNRDAASGEEVVDCFVTDPPYADAVNYHEITEFFISWLRGSPPPEFAHWLWDSRRRLAIKGKGDDFRGSMVNAYAAMTKRMADNGVQVVMFTHQDGKVWSDMAQIFWGAGLQVIADWYIATETTSELKKGGHVQGTHIIVLRKRPSDLGGFADEITLEVREAVAQQIEDMVGLNQSLKGRGRNENLFNDADLQMAGYAAALRVLTKYAEIDGRDMTVEAMRPRARNERTIVDEIIEYAVQVANEHLVPEGMDEPTWRKLTGAERFYLKMLDIETTGAMKADNYQNFSLAFRVRDRSTLMASETANASRLKTAAEFGKRTMGDEEFGQTTVRAVLYALWEMGQNVDDDLVLQHLTGIVDDYLARRPMLQVIARYIAMKREGRDRTESTNARVLAELIKNQRLG